MATNTMITLTTNSWAAEVEKSSTPVLVDFWAAWCGPCRMLSPIVEAMASEYSGTVKFCKLDADAEMGIASKYGIMALPTLLLFKDGAVVDKLVGLVPKTQIKQMLDKALR